MKLRKIRRPTLIIDKKKAVRNIRRMMGKITRSARSAESDGRIRFRPHFKTHKSARVGEWFRDLGVTAITVSSVEMASYFARHDWRDITIAILVNPREIETIDKLAGAVHLGLLVDSAERAEFIGQKLNHGADVWIKIDTDYHRTGIEWNRNDEILAAAEAIKKFPGLHFKGLLTHSGHAYKAKSTAELREIYHDTVTKMNGIRDDLKERGITGVEISIGDTPTCSAVDVFYGVDEVRCGNFVFYDVMQLMLGSCKEEDIAAAAACPVIARYPQRNEIVIYGGAVHLSTESIIDKNNQKIFGLVAFPFPNPESRAWGPPLKHTYVSALSQEHGIIKTTAELCRQVNVGDILMILPVHSCLTSNLLRPGAPLRGGAKQAHSRHLEGFLT
jgi:D-serine deaminase-like pyridoxal phosphate-dependent protein